MEPESSDTESETGHSPAPQNADSGETPKIIEPETEQREKALVARRRTFHRADRFTNHRNDEDARGTAFGGME
jgi:hypothetical protein